MIAFWRSVASKLGFNIMKMKNLVVVGLFFVGMAISAGQVHAVPISFSTTGTFSSPTGGCTSAVANTIVCDGYTLTFSSVPTVIDVPLGFTSVVNFGQIAVTGSNPSLITGGGTFTLQITQTIPGEDANFRSIVQKEVIPAEKKGGLAWRNTYAGTPLGAAFTYFTIRPVQSLSDFDKPGPITRALGAEAAEKLNARIAQTIATRQSMIQTFAPELSIDSHATAPAPLVVVEQIQLLPDKQPQFADWVRTQQLPLLRKLGVKDYWVFASTWGAPAGHRTIVEVIPNFAFLEPGQSGYMGRAARALGDDAAEKLNAQRVALVERQERTVLRLVPEMTFTSSVAPPQRTSK